MTLPYYLIDAFTDTAFKGNPAAVVILEEMLADDELQAIAREFNQAETAFVLNKGDHFHLRWFSPVREAELCGHATIAAAHALWHCQGHDSDSIEFESLGGRLIAQKNNDEITLDFPKTDNQMCMTPPGIAEALGVMPFGVCKADKDLLIEVGSADSVREAKVNMQVLAQLPVERGVIICAEHDDPDYDIICRFFAPKYGIPEDHVTGSAHCAIAPYFEKRINKEVMRSYQASSRGGSVSMQIKDDRVHLGGKACLVAEGILHI